MKMIEYVKLILEKVSFERELFEKELKKGLKTIYPSSEIRELRKWCFTSDLVVSTEEFSNRTFRRTQVTVSA
ncbi:MAG: hypothetical protein U5M51_01125 [Emticicia sp.]|nr:hypothetical protein [Emticicia sp.]